MKKIFTLLALVFCLNGWAQCVTPSAPTLTGGISNPLVECQGTGQVNIIVNTVGTPVWYVNSTFVSKGNPYAIYNNTVGTTVISVSDSAGAGCVSAPLTLTVVVNATPPNPILASPGVFAYCNGSVFSPINASGNGIILWYSDPSLSNLINTGNSFTPTNMPVGTIGLYLIDSSGTNGCKTLIPTTGSLSINPTPTISIVSLGSNSVICNGASIIIQPNGATTYTLFPGSLTGTSFTVTPTSPTTYTINGTLFNGCSNDPANAAVANIIVNPSPTVNLSGAIVDTAKCGLQNGGITGITASNIFGGTPPYNYQWYNGNNAIPGATLPSLNNVSAGVYNFQVVDANGCLGLSIGGLSTFSVPGIPALSVTYTLTQDAAPYTWDIYATYSSPNITATWDWGDGSTTNGLYPSHTYSVAGKYYICVNASISGNCSTLTCQNDSVYRLAYNSANSSMVYVNVFNGLSGIHQLSGNNEQVTLYPNPNNGVFNLSISQLENEKTNSIEVYNLIGECVHRQIVTSTNCQIDLGSLQNGIYNLSIISNEGVVNKRIVISH
jgi:hypothetical protein